MVSASLVAFLALLNLDRDNQYDAFLFIGFLEPLSPTAARLILSTIAGSMITVAGTVFSITIVTLTLAAKQFGPRLLRNFMQSTVTQIVLGSFLSTFVYSLCLLGSVETEGSESFVPGLSVNIAVVMALSSVGILIYFIHHVATSIQVSTVISNVYGDLINQLQTQFPEKSENNVNQTECDIETLDAAENTVKIAAQQCGYLQAIDHGAIESLARRNKSRFTLEQRSGIYITHGMPLVSHSHEVTLAEADQEEVRKAFILGIERTPEQDVEYAIHQLVEIAVRALSPGVNDPFTALECIDYLGSVLCQIAERSFPASHAFDEDENLIVVYKVVTFEGIVGAAFDQIRQHSRGNVAVVIRLLEIIHNAIQHDVEPEHRDVLLNHAKMIHRAGMENMSEELDRKDVNERFQAITDYLDSC